ncbi:preprotein translocase subunit SecG [Marinomonas spartinae]|uniref:preprotein translocase subunit SecG n=1 Tax=Marinomonas spartinae TaxID=1792290 RepID=UPI0018F21FF8|nr:preprotein translocase subunit SecG [Marinomonas spartinae]MBJ7552724.1 preprotein translocase subunit SecG [Marinomonas spartinae]
MEALILVLHVLAAVVIITLVLLQQGKGADAGASFGGGASQTVFGGQGSGSFFGKMTALFALIFFVTSFSLAYLASQQAKNISGAADLVPAASHVSNSVDMPKLGESKKKAPESKSDIPSTN